MLFSLNFIDGKKNYFYASSIGPSFLPGQGPHSLIPSSMRTSCKSPRAVSTQLQPTAGIPFASKYLLHHLLST